MGDGASLVYAINSFDSESDLGLTSFHVEVVEGPNLFGFVANDPVGLWDGFGTGKGGKQNIGCEGFTKRSCPEDVAKALEEAKKLKQAKRVKALQGLLKVIKRGGTMIWFWIEWNLELLDRVCPGGEGGIASANGDRMTSDGISTEDWDVVQDFAAEIANATIDDDDAAAECLTKQLLQHLEVLEGKYGNLPSIDATRADYISQADERINLLERAYEKAVKIGDKYNILLTASSLAEAFIEGEPQMTEAKRWLSRMADALGENWDDDEYRDFRQLTAKHEALRSKRALSDIG